MTTVDPILTAFRDALAEVYGNRIERVVLFGSRARGDAREDSDYDVAIFLRNLDDRYAELQRIALLQSRMMDTHNSFIHAIPFVAGSWAERTPIMHEIRREGRDL